MLKTVFVAQADKLRRDLVMVAAALRWSRWCRGFCS